MKKEIETKMTCLFCKNSVKQLFMGYQTHKSCFENMEQVNGEEFTVQFLKHLTLAKLDRNKREQLELSIKRYKIKLEREFIQCFLPRKEFLRLDWTRPRSNQKDAYRNFNIFCPSSKRHYKNIIVVLNRELRELRKKEKKQIPLFVPVSILKFTNLDKYGFIFRILKMKPLKNRINDSVKRWEDIIKLEDII